MRISEMRNLGPVTERQLADVGIETSEQLIEIGSVEAYQRLKFRSGRVSLNALYAMEAAILDVHWQHLDCSTKARLKAAAEPDRGSGVDPLS